MQVQPTSTDAALDEWRRAQFGVTDVLRRLQGDAFAAFGLGPSECTYGIVAADSYWRLRDYGSHDSSMPLLIVAAPIKRPYIWDLSPSVSAIRYCLSQRLRVHMLEWMPASRGSGNNGIEEYVRAIADCIAKISDAAAGTKPFLIGHSLGGTLAAIYASLASEKLSALVLLSAPLCFEPQANGFRNALVSLVPPNLSETEPFPGSLLSHMSALASPATFIWSRLMDAILSATDQRALEIHARVERWALDEVPLPGKLVHQIVEWLYRENRFCGEALKIHEALIGPFSLSAPTLAVVNMADDVAGLSSVKPFVDALPTNMRVLLNFQGRSEFVCNISAYWLAGKRARRFGRRSFPG